MTSRLTKWTYALLLGAFLLICASAYMIFSQAALLSRLRSDVARGQQELAQSQLVMARRNSQLMSLDEAVITTEEFLTGLDALTAFCRRPGLDGATTRLCDLFRVKSGTLAGFIGHFNSVAARRAVAEGPESFGRVRAAYEELLTMAGDFDAGPHWRARVNEGLAYADYRLGNLPRAGQEIETARSLDPSSVLVLLTGLKISCAANRPAAEIRRRYDAGLALLREEARSAAPPANGLAKEGIGRLGRDPELGLVCPGLPKPQISGPSPLR